MGTLLEEKRRLIDLYRYNSKVGEWKQRGPWKARLALSRSLPRAALAHLGPVAWSKLPLLQRHRPLKFTVTLTLG